MSGLPYRWRPTGTVHVPDSEIRVGMLWPHEHRVYRVVEVNPVPEVDWTAEQREFVMRYRPEARDARAPRHLVVRPVEVTGDDPRARDHDEHYAVGGGQHHRFEFYPDEHWTACGKCSEPLPCREQMADRVSDRAREEWARHEIPGVCPACSKPVTARQTSWTCPDNLVIPGGPPVTFHLRRECHWEAMSYEQRWAAASPGRRTELSCTGAVIAHGDGSYECSTGADCPGPRVNHPAWQACRCCEWAPNTRHCVPRAGAPNRAATGGQETLNLGRTE